MDRLASRSSRRSDPVCRWAAAGLLLAVLSVAGPAGAQDAEAPAPVYVQMTTTAGDLVIELFPAEAPTTVENFLRYVREGFYDGTIFHRVIPGFVIQGGGFTADFVRKDIRDPIENEADNGLKNLRGTLSMARTSAVDSATSQFFVNLVDNAALDHTGTTSSRAWGYAVFGRVVRGMDAVDRIAATPTGPAGPFRSDVPVEPMIIEAATVITTLPAEAPAAEATNGETPSDDAG